MLFAIRITESFRLETTLRIIKSNHLLKQGVYYKVITIKYISEVIMF